MEQVILVDENDNELGVMEKMEAHRKGVLHRAFSVCLFNDKGEILLQQRAKDKYHSAGLWSNTCCSHPRPEEDILEAASRRLIEEMGVTVNSPLSLAYTFIYKTQLDNSMIEHELDYVIVGEFSGDPVPNSSEICSWKYVNMEQLKLDIKNNTDLYTYWFKMIVESKEFQDLNLKLY